MLQYETRVSSEGYIMLPPEYHNRKIMVLVQEEQDGADQQQAERQQRMAAQRARILERTPEERQAAAEKFMKTWKGCLKGVPHMTAKEIRAERLEKKYGNKHDKSTD
jgi:hypothetical protein